MRYKYFDLILGVFVAVLLISNIASTKILQLGRLTFDGGTLLFPLSYLLNDVLTEVYGYRRSRRVIWTGFFSATLMSGVLFVVGRLQPAEGWELQNAYMAILGQTPRIVVASLIAYFAGEFSNSYVLAKMKIFTKGRWLWTRTIASTIIGELLDTLLFVMIAFYGVLPVALLVSVALSNYIFKVGFEVLATPLTYIGIAYLKKQEQEDVYDTDTNFNPFRV
jgi:uncharacterized integral membrane protein (TIGR00697 family)